MNKYDFTDNQLLSRIVESMLVESKDHLIDRIPNLDDERRERMKRFFRRNPSLEKRFDWNRPNDITWSAFSRLEDDYPEPIDPDTVPEFSDKKNEGDGIVSYLVQDDKFGQKAVRNVIDTHWGKDDNPWCLAARKRPDHHGERTLTQGFRDWINRLGSDGIRERREMHGGHYDFEEAYERETGLPSTEDYDELAVARDAWVKYSALPKRIAFKNGRLLAFMATNDNLGDNPYMVFFKNEYESRAKHNREWNKFLSDNPKRMVSPNFAEWLDANYPDEVTRVGVSPEEWWDRNDKSHPNLDFAR